MVKTCDGSVMPHGSLGPQDEVIQGEQFAMVIRQFWQQSLGSVAVSGQIAWRSKVFVLDGSVAPS